MYGIRGEKEEGKGRQREGVRESPKTSSVMNGLANHEFHSDIDWLANSC
jgi:hypothetical protein